MIFVYVCEKAAQGMNVAGIFVPPFVEVKLFHLIASIGLVFGV